MLNKFQIYFGNDCNQCPYCESQDIEILTGFEQEDNKIWQRKCCNECNKEWSDNYEITSIETPEGDAID